MPLLALVWRFWPRDGATRWPDPKSGLSFAQSLREMAEALGRSEGTLKAQVHRGLVRLRDAWAARERREETA